MTFYIFVLHYNIFVYFWENIHFGIRKVKKFRSEYSGLNYLYDGTFYTNRILKVKTI